jgi:hypothetical protein
MALFPTAQTDADATQVLTRLRVSGRVNASTLG